ncbi:MAG: recombination mediator RecR [Verrucomicrobiae bacterium]
MPLDYPAPFLELARELRRLPGIGPRSAERIALWLLSNKDARPAALAATLAAAREMIRSCRRCGFFATGDLCEICAQPSRRGREMCVVEQATDILPLERTGDFGGVYHALGGRLAPLDHIGPEDLRIGPLVARIPDEAPTEIILALSADVEGEATTNYLIEILAPLGVPVTRIAHGLPAGGGLEHADQVTLQRALSGRRPAGERFPACQRAPAEGK